ncbi:hypothetical protein GL50803_009305 [Giardia duodenalis]|uniref:Uncharacterized protein n=2 Tax=Giardia intestinalis TaxID=5741 RepID=A8BPB1_GIAIC|nr:hypothetical protein GL50803_009305 [Giardia intestinalis]ESU37798.1 Chromosome segregation ATPase [Giardia intestinalis]KAE8303319.1 hypothetical protein GL50803_009305 [Giardia intestinalis]|eukprot:XP_001705716.1 Hypothetical protein GL50803_9305 [Giardia lamblia ATCC 50803]
MDSYRSTVSTNGGENRVSILTDRLVRLQSKIEQNRLTKIDAIQTEIEDCEERLDEAEAYREDEMQKIKEYLVKLFELIGSEKRAMAYVQDSKTIELRDVDDVMQATIGDFKVSQKESTSRMTTVSEKYYEEMDTLVAALIAEQNETYARNKKTMETDLLQLQEELEQEELMSSTILSELETTARNSIAELRQRLKSLEHERKKAEIQIKNLIVEVQSRLDTQIAKETQEREEIEQTMLSIVEQTAVGYLNMNDNV